MSVWGKPLILRPDGTATGPIATFAGAGAPLRGLTAILPLVQLGSGTPDPSNIRPIIPYTGITVNATKKNLFDEATAPIYNRYFYSTGGTYRWRSSSDSRSYIFRCKPSTTYTVTATSASLAIFRAGYITEHDLSSLTTTGPYIYGYTLLTGPGSITVQTGADATYLVIQGTKAVMDARTAGVQVELGSSAATVEAYAGQAITEDWSGTLGQIAAANYDALAGTLTVISPWWELDGTENWVTIGSLGDGTRYFRTSLGAYIHPSASSENRICSHYPGASITTSTTDIGFAGVYANSVTYLAFRPDLGVIPTADDWKTFLTAQKTAGTPVQCSLVILSDYRTPTQLTPRSVNSYSGLNNVWSDAGDVAVRYAKQSMIYMS